KLKILYSNYIIQEGIKDLRNIEELYILNNKNITNVNHLTKLKKLSSYYITQEGIKDLRNIENLDISFNSKIIDVNHLTKLKILRTKLTQEGIKDLKIKNIYNYGNYHLYTIRT